MASVSAVQYLAFRGGRMGRALACVNAGYAAAVMRIQWLNRSWDDPGTYLREILLRAAPFLLGIALGAAVVIFEIRRTKAGKRPAAASVD